jgi:hypothetical protein
MAACRQSHKPGKYHMPLSHDAAVLPKQVQIVYIQSIKLIQSHPSDTKQV